MHGQDGAVRPHWQVLDRALRAFGPGEMWRRWEQARQLIRQHGVTFNVYGDARGLERPWPLDPVPVCWRRTSSPAWRPGSRSARRCSIALLRDLYGPRRVLLEGLVPPEMLLAHPGLLRAVRRDTPPGERFLQFYAADLVRTPEGELRGAGGPTQAPSGAGYALENRIVLARVLPEAFRDCNGAAAGAVLPHAARHAGQRSRRTTATTRASCCSPPGRTTRRTSSRRSWRSTSATRWSRAAI